MAVVSSPSAGPAPGVDPGFSWSLLGPLSLILLLLLATLLLLRFVRLQKSGLRSGVLSLVAQTSLSPAHSLYVVQAGGRYLLLGGAPGGLSLLTELPAHRLTGSERGTAALDEEAEDDDEAGLLDDAPLPAGPHPGAPTSPALSPTANR